MRVRTRLIAIGRLPGQCFEPGNGKLSFGRVHPGQDIWYSLGAGGVPALHDLPAALGQLQALDAVVAALDNALDESGALEAVRHLGNRAQRDAKLFAESGHRSLAGGQNSADAKLGDWKLGGRALGVNNKEPPYQFRQRLGNLQGLFVQVTVHFPSSP